MSRCVFQPAFPIHPSRKSLYNALQDVAAHLVVEADGLAQAKQLNLGALGAFNEDMHVVTQ